MKRCIQLAMLGLGNVAPNPMVGSVIVYEGRIIGEGFHQKYGESHAEVNAVNSVLENNKTLLSKSTIYVSLEPCAHQGKTPPCALLLVQHKFKRVVIGCRDSYDKVDGKGIQILKENNIEVTLGVLEEECIKLNEHFFYYHQQKKPFITLKWAQTKNKLISNSKNTGITWISSPETQVFVHQLRVENQAILIGKNTAINDNPSLTVRRVKGPNPTRIILDSKLQLPHTLKVFDSEAKTIIINLMKSETVGNIQYFKIEKLNPENIAKALYQLNIQSVLIEGGQKVLQSFIDANLWQKAIVISGSHTFETGVEAPKLSKEKITSFDYFKDLIEIYENN